LVERGELTLCVPNVYQWRLVIAKRR